jgi:protein-tyrosine phosphatase
MSVTSATHTRPSPKTDQPENVSFSAVFFSKSHWFSFLGGTVGLGATVKWIVPLAASQLQITFNPELIEPLLITLAIGAAILGWSKKKELIYEAAILHSISISHVWWSVINENIILGAIPLEHQIDELKALGVSRVVALLEESELKPGLIRPAQPSQLAKAGIIHKRFKAVDYFGVKPKQIHAVVEYVDNEIQMDPSIVIYINCKSGKGRSTTVVVGYLVKKTKKFESKESAYAYVKDKRPTIHLNHAQMDSLNGYLRKY